MGGNTWNMATNTYSSKTGSLAWTKQILAQRQCSGSSRALYTDLPGLVLPKEWSHSQKRARTGSSQGWSQGSLTVLTRLAKLLFCISPAAETHRDSMRTLSSALHNKVESPPLEITQKPLDAILCQRMTLLEQGGGTTWTPVAPSLTHSGIHLNWWSRF